MSDSTQSQLWSDAVEEEVYVPQAEPESNPGDDPQEEISDDLDDLQLQQASLGENKEETAHLPNPNSTGPRGRGGNRGYRGNPRGGRGGRGGNPRGNPRGSRGAPRGAARGAPRGAARGNPRGSRGGFRGAPHHNHQNTHSVDQVTSSPASIKHTVRSMLNGGLQFGEISACPSGLTARMNFHSAVKVAQASSELEALVKQCLAVLAKSNFTKTSIDILFTKDLVLSGFEDDLLPVAEKLQHRKDTHAFTIMILYFTQKYCTSLLVSEESFDEEVFIAKVPTIYGKLDMKISR